MLLQILNCAHIMCRNSLHHKACTRCLLPTRPADSAPPAGLLGTAPRAALCLGRLLLQQRAAGSRGGRERSRGRATATRASWGLDDTTERRTVSSRGSDRFGRDRDRERRGGGPRDGPRDRPPRGGGGREAGRWGRNDRDERRGGGSGEQEPQRWGRNDRDERRGGGSGEQEPQRWGRNDRDERQGGDGRGPERWGRSNRDERQGGGGGRGQQQGQGPAVPRWAAQDDEYSWEEEEREEGEEGWGRPGQGGGGRGGGRDWGQQQQQPKAPTLRDQWVSCECSMLPALASSGLFSRAFHAARCGVPNSCESA